MNPAAADACAENFPRGHLDRRVHRIVMRGSDCSAEENHRAENTQEKARDKKSRSTAAWRRSIPFVASSMVQQFSAMFALYGLSCDHFRTQRTLLCEPRLAGIGRLVLDEFVSENRHGRAALPANDAAAGQVP